MKLDFSRFRWPRGLRYRCATVLLLGLWVPIPPGTWMSVFCEWPMSYRLRLMRGADSSSRVVLPSVYVSLSVVRYNNHNLLLE
jgi:hypothetical protein